MSNPMPHHSGFAHVVMHAEAKAMGLRDELFDRVVVILGGDPEKYDEWPIQEIGHDWHDMSVVLHASAKPLVLTTEQMIAIRNLGYHMIDTRYADGTSEYFTIDLKLKSLTPEPAA